jgi:hypothetical protein
MVSGGINVVISQRYAHRGFRREKRLERIRYLLTSPKEESGSEAAVELRSKTPQLEGQDGEVTVGQVAPANVESSPRYDEKSRLEAPTGKIRRPSIVRTSTSGTQVFTPNLDGIELDGLPTGPSSETWDGSMQGDKGKERSFL